MVVERSKDTAIHAEAALSNTRFPIPLRDQVPIRFCPNFASYHLGRSIS